MSENNWPILFHSPTLIQKRNIHNLLDDFKKEIPAYMLDGYILNKLFKIKLKHGQKNLSDNMIKCYENLVKVDIFKKKEIYLLKLWLSDYQNLI